MIITRRKLLESAVLASTTSLTTKSIAAVKRNQNRILFDQAIAALGKHNAQIKHRDIIGIVDFSAPSRAPRFHLLNMVNGDITSLLVSHGKGSDPKHSGWLQKFSNVHGSEATSSGAYLTGKAYIGKHGQSQRLIGLDPENDQAESRAIVMHGAKYVSTDIIAAQGKLGRSQGCFAFSPSKIAQVMEQLGQGRLLFASK